LTEQLKYLTAGASPTEVATWLNSIFGVDPRLVHQALGQQHCEGQLRLIV